MSNKIKNNIFIGVVEDNNDPKKKGRCRVRVLTVYDSIPTSDIPWATPYKDLNGNEFNAPEIGKIVTVVFDKGNIYKPEFIFAEHYNINLENKLNALSSDDYTTFKSLFMDGSTQIYRSKSEGLKIDHEYTNINLDSNGSINLNLRDNNSKLNLGSPDASQAAILGTSYTNWESKLLNLFLTNAAFLGNQGAPITATPALIDTLNEFITNLTPKFLSNNVWLVDNTEVKEQTREYINQQGDKWTSTTQDNTMTTISNPTYTPVARADTGRPDIKNSSVPGDITSQTIESDATVQTVSVNNYPNGQVPTSAMTLNKYLSKDLGGDAAYLKSEASAALDNMMSAYNNANFTGKQKVVFTDGYRSLQRQQALYDKYGAGRAAKPGTSNHGWGIAIDMYWGVRTSMNKDIDNRPSAYKHPVYQWFFNNGHLYGWYNPIKLRDDGGTDEWWHWEYYGKNENVEVIANRYKGDFTSTDATNIKKAGGTYA